MAVLTFNVTINQGETWEQNITILGADFSAVGLVGRCQIRRMASQDSTVIAEPTVTFPTGGDDNVINLALTAAETSAILNTSRIPTTADTYYYDVFVDDTTVSTKYVMGTVSLYPSITR